MEFIGDRVLGLLIAEWLVERFPKEHEGDLGHRLGALVSQPVLAAVAEEIGLGEALAVAANEARDGVRRRASVLADALEAVLAALYFDGGIDAARNFIRRAWSNVMEEQREPPKDCEVDAAGVDARARPWRTRVHRHFAYRAPACTGVRGDGIRGWLQRNRQGRQ